MGDKGQVAQMPIRRSGGVSASTFPTRLQRRSRSEEHPTTGFLGARLLVYHHRVNRNETDREGGRNQSPNLIIGKLDLVEGPPTEKQYEERNGGTVETWQAGGRSPSWPRHVNAESRCWGTSVWKIHHHGPLLIERQTSVRKGTCKETRSLKSYSGARVHLTETKSRRWYEGMTI